MLILYLLLIAFVVGGITAGRNLRRACMYIPLALLGAIAGAFLAFGDAPFLIRFPFLNQFTLSLTCAAILVVAVHAWKGRKPAGESSDSP